MWLSIVLHNAVAYIMIICMHYIEIIYNSVTHSFSPPAPTAPALARVGRSSCGSICGRPFRPGNSLGAGLPLSWWILVPRPKGMQLIYIWHPHQPSISRPPLHVVLEIVIFLLQHDTSYRSIMCNLIILNC